jgi:signal transduction histidine kinase
VSSGRPLFVNLAWGIVVGVLVIHAATTAYSSHERMLDRAQTFAQSTVDRALVYRDLDARTGQLVAALGGDEFRASFASQPRPVTELSWPHNDEIHAVIESMLAARNVADRDRFLYGFVMDGKAGHFLLSLPTRDGQWLIIDAKTDALRAGFGAFGTTVLTLIILGIVLLATRRLTRYLPQFVDAAESMGRGMITKALPEDRGPREVRRASRAFNGMQQRVHSLITERTQMLASVSHDLRTIATRLRLRMDGISDSVERIKAERDLEAMVEILESSLTFARDELSEEAWSLLDLRSLLQTVVDDAADGGGDAQLILADEQRAKGACTRGQPVALRRAFQNLIDNAIRYGGKVRVVLKSDGLVEICDPGPGIAPEDIERALQPFVRLENSRNRDTGGTGLGLAIAASVIKRHQGTLTFSQGSTGFTVSVFLPPASV